MERRTMQVLDVRDMRNLKGGGKTETIIPGGGNPPPPPVVVTVNPDGRLDILVANNTNPPPPFPPAPQAWSASILIRWLAN